MVRGMQTLLDRIVAWWTLPHPEEPTGECRWCGRWSPTKILCSPTCSDAEDRWIDGQAGG